MTEFNLETLTIAMDKMKSMPPQPRICITEAAVEFIPDGYNFHLSRNRSARTHKKLLKRYGKQEKFIKKPAILKVEGDIWIHTIYEADLRREMGEKVQDRLDNMAFGAMCGVTIFYGGLPPKMPFFERELKIECENKSPTTMKWSWNY